MTQEEKQAMVQAMFQGADLSGVRQIIAINEGDVCYQKFGDGKATVPDEKQQAIIEKLKPIFYGSEEVATEFLMSIQGMKGTQITAKVNQMVKEKKISELSRKHDLWLILHESNIYEKTEQNWNSQVE